MADTVEQVYVWDGNDWVPVVRDETVSKTSELTNDGEDGVNPFITAADIPAVPDKKLPISSADGTVVLDSPSANTFTISTGGQERAKVTDNVTSVNNRFLVGTNSLQAEMGLLKTDASVWDVNQPHAYGLGHAVVEAINFKQGTDGTYAGYSMSAFRSDGMEQSAFIGVVSKDTSSSISALGGDVVITTRNDGGTQQELVRLNNEAATFGGDVQTAKIVGPADNDASIELGSELLTTNHTPTQPNSIATKQTVDDKIQVMTTAEYNALATKNPTTLYCLTD